VIYRHLATNGFYSPQAHAKAVNERGFKSEDFELCNDDGSPAGGAVATVSSDGAAADVPKAEPASAPAGPDPDSAPQWRDNRSGAYLSPNALRNHLAWGHPADAFEACGSDGSPLSAPPPVLPAPEKKKHK